MHTFNILYTYPIDTLIHISHKYVGGVDKRKGTKAKKRHKILFKKKSIAKRLWTKAFIKQYWVDFLIENSLSQTILKMLSKKSTYNIQDLKLIYLRKKSFFTKFFAQSTVKETKKYMERIKMVKTALSKGSFQNTKNTSEQ